MAFQSFYGPNFGTYDYDGDWDDQFVGVGDGDADLDDGFLNDGDRDADDFQTTNYWGPNNFNYGPVVQFPTISCPIISPLKITFPQINYGSCWPVAQCAPVKKNCCTANPNPCRQKSLY